MIIPETQSNVKTLLDARFSVIPLMTDGSKSPALKWSEFITRRMSVAEITQHFSRPRGIAVVAGSISGNLETIDFDDGDFLDPWLKSLPADLASRLVIVRSPREPSGYHVHYRCSAKVEGNQKLAVEPLPANKIKTLIETRGQGGYIAVPGGDPRLHPTGKPYQYIQRDLPSICTITPKERSSLLDAARSFDRGGLMEAARKEAAQKEAARIRALTSKPKAPSERSTPWDDYNARATWDDVLRPAGWHSEDGVKWFHSQNQDRRHISAAVRVTDSGEAVLVVFSTTGVLASNLPGSHTTYSKFKAFARLYHNDDFRKAARALRLQGYGK
jgi:putative DNA primase/helicase